MVSPQDLSAYEEAMSLGATGVEVVTIPRPRNYSKSTTEVKEKSLAVRAMKRENTREQQKTIIALEAINVKREFLCVVIFGIIMTFITLALASIAFGLPEWRLYKVDKRFNHAVDPDLFPCKRDSSVSTCQFKYSRCRGMFVTCYTKPKNDLNLLYPPSMFTLPYANGDDCIWEQKYNIQGTSIVIKDNCGQDPNIADAASLVSLNTNLMRAHWMCWVLALVMLLTAFILALVSFKCIRVLGLMLAALFALIATLLLVAGMGLFHGYIHIEENLLPCPPFYATLKKDIYKNLLLNTGIVFGMSFWMGWISVCTGLVAAAFLLGAACKRRSSMLVINKALDCLRDLNKDEKLDKKYEQVQERIRRKEKEAELKIEEKNLKRMSQQPRMMDFGMMPPLMYNPRISDSHFHYRKIDEDKAMLEKLELEKAQMQDKYALFEKKCEKRLKKIEGKLKKEVEVEKQKLELEKKRVIESAKDREGRPKQKRRWMGRFGRKEQVGYYSEESDISSDERYEKRASSVGERVPTRCSVLSGGICNDPYTLHLPTGGNKY